MAVAHTLLQNQVEGGHNGSLQLGVSSSHEISLQVVATAPLDEVSKAPKGPVEGIIAVQVSNNGKNWDTRDKISFKGEDEVSVSKEYTLPYLSIRAKVVKLTPGALVSVYAGQ